MEIVDVNHERDAIWFAPNDIVWVPAWKYPTKEAAMDAACDYALESGQGEVYCDVDTAHRSFLTFRVDMENRHIRIQEESYWSDEVLEVWGFSYISMRGANHDV